ncbi:hypothetical protein [Lactococcus taiwanensis]|uniref:hypothetical protein n=1 Tax=Lactococcus taiwanensis TaxID=1151742 RepID=UPI0035153362
MQKFKLVLFSLATVLCCGIVAVVFFKLQSRALSPVEGTSPNPYYYSADHAVAQNGYVFVSPKKGYYYFEVTKPEDFQHLSQSEADKSGFIMDPNVSTLN